MRDNDNNDSGLGLGTADAFGLDEFGQVAGNVWMGALAGALVQSGSAAAIRRFTSYGAWAEAIGAAIGAAAGAVMIGTVENKALGWNCIAVSLANGLVRQLEQSFRGAGAVSGVDIERLSGLGEVQIEGLGNASVETPYQLGRDGQDPQLMGGHSLGQVADQVQLNGGPGISSLGGHFGATLFGGTN